jgi:hypothetical protein
VRRFFAAAGACFVAAASCSDWADVGYDFGSGGQGAAAGREPSGGLAVNTGGSTGGLGLGSGGATPECEQRTCRGKLYACGNCDDDDGDQRSDALDPDCLGPCDDDEATLSPGTVAANCRLDCTFDRNAGLGNDRCDWDQRCDELSPGASMGCASSADTLDDPSCAELNETQSDRCLESCLPLTPNGCDCFGCCELPARSGSFVWIGAPSSGGQACSVENAEDPELCPPCTPVTACQNPCEECEACVGGGAPSASCASPDQPVCGPGVTVCASGAACPADRYCVTGCCIIVPS